MHVSGMDATKDSSLGCPHGGVCVYWKSALSSFVKSLSTSSNRLCAIQIQMRDCTVILVSCYFQCDDGSGDGDNHELLDIF